MKALVHWAFATGFLFVSPVWAGVIDRELLQGRMQGLGSQVIVQGEGVDLNGVTYFSGTSLEYGTELWRSDGTAEGTTIVRDIVPGGGSSSPSMVTLVGERVFFQAGDSVHGRELWASNGAYEGTYLVKDIASGAASAFPAAIVALGTRIYFRAFAAGSGWELWASDGTEAGTVLVADIEAGPIGSFPAYLTALGDRIYFRAFTAQFGSELWSSDGTAAGTALVRDIEPGPASSSPFYLNAIGSALYFRILDAQLQVQLWISLGNGVITAPLRGIEPGTARLSWQPPYRNEDSSILTDLAGYQVHFGLEPARLDRSVDVVDPASWGHTVRDLPPGKYYFMVSAYNSSGIHSEKAGPVSTVIR